MDAAIIAASLWIASAIWVHNDRNNVIYCYVMQIATIGFSIAAMVTK